MSTTHPSAEEDLRQFAGAHVDVPITRLWWQHGGECVRRLSEHVLVTGGQTTAGCRGDTKDPHEVVRGLKRQFTAGWGNVPRVKIAVDEHGYCVLTDGLHRSAAAYHAGLRSVPAEIVFRATPWWRLKYALRAAGGGKATLYQPVDHPDLAAWPCWRRDTEERARVIAGYTREVIRTSARIADVACHTGAITRALAHAGFDCVGIDTSEPAIRAAELLAAMGEFADPRARFLRSDTTVPLVPASDIVVCLSLLNHHMVDGRSDQGHEIVRRCLAAAPVLILDAPAPGDPVGGCSPFVNPIEVLAWVGAAGITGNGRVLAERGNGLQRTLLVWER